MLNKKIIFCIFLLVFSILITNISYAIQQVTISNIKIIDNSGNQLYPKDGISVITNADGSPITYGQKFYVEFDATNTGDIPFSGTYFGIYPYNFEKKYLDLKIGEENKISMRIETSFLSTTCFGEKDLLIYINPWGTSMINNVLPFKIKYKGGPDCPFLTTSLFKWLPEHPAYINNTDNDENPRYFGAKYLINNTGSSEFKGKYTLTLSSLFGFASTLTPCTKTGDITIPLANEQGHGQVEIKIDPSDSSDPKCPVGAYGNSNLIINDLLGNKMNFIQSAGSAASYIVDIPSWTIDSINLDKLGYLSTEKPKIYAVQTVYAGYSPLSQSIPAGSTYHLWVVDVNKPENKLYDSTIILPSMPIKSSFGTTLPNIIANYLDLGLAELEFVGEVPENIDIFIEIKNDVGNPILTTSLGRYYNPYVKRINLKQIHLCDSTNNKGCSCTSSINDDITYGKIYQIICDLVKIPDFTITKEYGTRFIFDSSLEKNLKNNFIEVVLTPSQTIGELSFLNYIQFNSIPKPDSTTSTDYTFKFKCDNDKDGRLAEFCGGDDCNDNDENIYPSAEEICNSETNYLYNGVDKNCDGIPLDCSSECDNDGDGWANKASCLLTFKYNIISWNPFAYSESLDCNDNDPTINPGTEETYCDGVDQNCDGKDGIDEDKDGWNLTIVAGGTCGTEIDCNDDNINVNPGMLEICNNGVDDNCDGLMDLFPAEQKVDLPVYLTKNIDFTGATLNVDCRNKIGGVCKDPINTITLLLLDKEGKAIPGVNVCVGNCNTNILPQGLIFWHLYTPTDENGRVTFSYALPKIDKYEIKFVTPSKYKLEGDIETQEITSIESSVVSISQKA